MFIEVIKNNGKDYLRLVHAVRKPNKNGDMVSSKRVLLNIGPMDRYDDGLPDYIGRLRKSFKAGVPLIPELKPYSLSLGGTLPVQHAQGKIPADFGNIGEEMLRPLRRDGIPGF